MKTKIKVKRTVHIEMTEREAVLLRWYLQNYHGSDEEPPDSQAVRKALFEALCFW